MESRMDPLLIDVVTILSEILAIAGALIIFYAGVVALILFVIRETKRSTRHAYNRIRDGLTHRLILGLDFLIAADIILTVIRPSLEEVVILAVVVAIRTVLTLSLIKEAKELDALEGVSAQELDPPSQ
jgi:uncharacterized membrane protein